MRIFRSMAAVWTVLVGLAFLSPAHAEQNLARMTVHAGDHARIDTPVSASLDGVPDSLLQGGVRLIEVTDSGREPVPCQIAPGDPPRLCWVLSGRTPAGAERVYELTKGEAAAEEAVRLRTGEKALRVLCGDRPVVQYNHAPVPPPEGHSKLYTRSGFIHPLRTLDGAVLTTIHPSDHIHHLGLWNPWTKTEFEGRHIDFWNLSKGEGTVRHVKFDSRADGPVFAAFRAAKEHVDLTAPGGEKVALDEELDVRVWGSTGDGRGYLMDCVITQSCASSSPLHLPPYRYGGMGFRATEYWNKNNSNYLTSKGKTRKDGHATRSRWCKTFGETPKGHAGIVFMSHPENREHPEPMRIWPHGPIFFNYCSVQKKAWTLRPGNTYVRRYRFYVYDGEVNPGTAERLWQGFAHPPKVTIEVSGNLEAGLPNRFFVFDNGVGRGEWPPEKQARVLKELGYGGIACAGPVDMTERLKAFESPGLRLVSIYVGVNLDQDPHYDPRLKQAIQEMAATDCFIWLYVRGKAGQDEEAVAVIREVADMAAKAGVKVALYPHYGFYVATVDDALRLMRKAGRDNVGVSFNLCHSLRVGNADRLDEILKEAAPHLFLVSINGAGKEGDDWSDEGWDRLIQTLDRGEFDTAGLLKKLRKLGYTGPIGLQCYGIGGDPVENLKRSMDAWRKISARAASGE